MILLHGAKRFLKGIRLIQLYYFITPLFFIISYFWHINVRISFLDALPIGKSIYFCALFGCGFILYFYPGMTNLVAITESSVNILGLLTSFVINYRMVFTDLVADKKEIVNPFTTEWVINFSLAAIIWSLAFRYYTTKERLKK